MVQLQYTPSETGFDGLCIQKYDSDSDSDGESESEGEDELEDEIDDSIVSDVDDDE